MTVWQRKRDTHSRSVFARRTTARRPAQSRQLAYEPLECRFLLAVDALTTVSLQDGLNGYNGTRDTSIRGDNPNANFGSRSKLELDGKPDQVTLIRWDTTLIPSSSTVTSVALTFDVVSTSFDEYEIYQALRPWDESMATFQLAASGQSWEIPGGDGVTDRGRDVLGTLTGRSKGLVTVPLNALGVAMVQSWISNPSGNQGIVIQDLADRTTDDLDISSREQARRGPMLTVTYTSGSITPTNGPPVANGDSYSLKQNATLSVSAKQGVLSNDTDPEGDGLAAIRVTDPSHGTLNLNKDGSFVYIPDKNFNGTDSFTYRADDGEVHTYSGQQPDVGTVTISVGDVAHDPLAVDDTITTTKNTKQTVDVLSNDSDPDGDSISISDYTRPSHGTVSRSGSKFTYAPDKDYTGSDSFRYSIRDKTGRTASAAIIIEVKGGVSNSDVVFRVMADIPYSKSDYKPLKNDIANVGSNDLFFMHLGDIKSGSGSCSSSVYSGVADVLLASEKTVFIVPGDNEWNDCSNPNQAWSNWDKYFSRFDEHWKNDFTVLRQPQREENFAFVYDGVLFIGLNLVGGRVHDKKEWAQRMEDNAQWVRDNFAKYSGQVSSAVVFGHAYPDGARQAFGDAFVSAAQQFEKPILYMMGDQHNWKLDHPFSKARNVTRVVVDQGAPSVRVTVTHDPDNPFQFDRSP